MRELLQRITGFVFSTLLLGGIAGMVQAFELLSEGAMGSVSAVSVNSSQDIVNIAGSAAAGLKDDKYESLPFEANANLESFSNNTAAPEIEFSLTQEVEVWANNLREQNGVSNFQVGYTDQLQPSLFENPGIIVPQDSIESVILAPSTDGSVEVIYQQGRIDEVVRTFQQGIDSVTFEIERYVERAATIDAKPFGEDSPSIGSGYVSDLRSVSHIGITAIRD